MELLFMCNVTLIDPVKDERWDKFVVDHPFGWLYHLSGWKQVLEKSFKHMKGYYFALISNGAIKAALPVFEVKSWLSGNKLVSIPYATLFDPLISNSYEMNTLLKAVMELAEELNIHQIKLVTHQSHSLIENGSLGVQHNYKHHYLLLDKKPEDLKKTFDRTCTRQRISRAIKSKLVLKKGCDEADLLNFYKLYVKTRKRNGFPPQPYKFLNTLRQEFYPSQNIILLMAEYKKQPIAGLILFKFKNRMSAEYAASDNNYRNLSPNHFLFWEAIKLANDENLKIFDFGRTSSKNLGLMNFKKRWGTKVVDLPDFYYPKEAFEKIGEKDYEFAKKIIRNSPDVVLKIMGNIIYRYM